MMKYLLEQPAVKDSDVFHAESYILSAILNSVDGGVDGIFAKLDADHFYDTRHRQIFAALAQLHQSVRSLDIVNLQPLINDPETMNVAIGLMSVYKSGSRMKAAVESLLTRHFRKVLGDGLRAATYHLDQGASAQEAMREANEALANASKVIVTDSTLSFAKSVTEMLRDMSNPKKGTYMGFDHLPALREGDLCVLAARPSMGKTALATQIATHIAHMDIPSLIISMEMTRHQITQRLTSQISNVFLSRIINNELNDYDHQVINDKMGSLADIPLYIDDTGGLTMDHLEIKIRQQCHQNGIKFIMVDYLQLMNVEKYGNRNEGIGSVTRRLKGLAKEYGISVLILSQLSRKVEQRSMPMPILSDLRESGEIEQDADIVMMLFRPEYYNISEIDLFGQPEGTEGLAVLNVAKYRNGSTGSKRLRFTGPTVSFSEYENPNNPF